MGTAVGIGNKLQSLKKQRCNETGQSNIYGEVLIKRELVKFYSILTSELFIS